MTADARFRRSERVHLELPVRPGPKADSGRLLDRSGLAVDVPVPVSERTDAKTGRRWIMADVTRASLPPADYVIEVRIADAPDAYRTVAASIRVVK